MKLVLINCDTCQVLKVTDRKDDTFETLMYWADILAPNDDFKICGLATTEYTSFTKEKLAVLYFNVCGKELGPITNYIVSLNKLVDEIKRLEIDNTSLEEVKKKLGKPLSGTITKPAEAPQKEYSPPTDKPVGDTGLPKRPKAGTATGKVWDIADSVFNAYPEASGDINKKEFKKYIIEQCVAQGINQATAQVQFGKWKGSK